ncbi:MAG: hypothetical protein V3R89_09670, partial [Thermoanaerobaculia bacterium]
EEGKHVSISYVAEYELMTTEYRETPIYWMMNDEIEGTGVSYEWPADKSASSPVTIEDGRITIAVRGEPPVLVFEGDRITATTEGQFVDHWERVD